MIGWKIEFLNFRIMLEHAEVFEFAISFFRLNFGLKNMISLPAFDALA